MGFLLGKCLQLHINSGREATIMNVILISCSCTKYTPWDYHILESEKFESHHKVQNEKTKMSVLASM